MKKKICNFFLYLTCIIVWAFIFWGCFDIIVKGL